MSQEIVGTDVNCETGEVTYIYRTPEYDAKMLLIQQQEEARAAEAAAKAAQREALLERLGITEEEAQLLLGGN